MSEWIDLTEGMVICELCSRYYSSESFYAHLSQHTKEEVEVLKKLAEKSMSMTEEQYRDFIVHLEIEAYRKARESMEIDKQNLRKILFS